MINLQGAGIELTTPGSAAVRQVSAARHITDSATRPAVQPLNFNYSDY